ncbi:hypothetical protein ACQB60_10145 [Actinomycetota bacterium Odt1-20B]
MYGERDLAFAGVSTAGLIAWYSRSHVHDDEISVVLAHFPRVLRPGDPLLIGCYVGEESRLKTEGYGGRPMNV